MLAAATKIARISGIAAGALLWALAAPGSIGAAPALAASATAADQRGAATEASVTGQSDQAIQAVLTCAPWAVDLDCGACHAKQMPSEQADGETPATTAQEGEQADEQPGTAIQADTPANKPVAELVPFHTNNLGFSCTTCHFEDTVLAGLHEEPSNKKVRRLKYTEVSDSLCLSCHDADALVTAAQDFDGLSDSKGTVVNPHAVPANDAHEAVTCVSCHVGHDDVAIEEQAFETCTNCHHANVFACGTCHK